ncbi:BRO family protein [Geomonas terrae]|nr:Bro-N domain-containing protein [Geomonas terrae]
MTTGLEINVTLGKIFGETWARVRTVEHDGRVMHMAHDICGILGIKNVTVAIHGVDGAYRVDLENRDKVYVPEWTTRRRVHVLSIEGVFQLIFNNTRSVRCKEIKKYIACHHLPRVRFLKLHQSTERDTALLR